MACRIRARLTVSGRYSTKAFSAVRFTVAETTPGSRFMALSTRATQAAQVIPFTGISARATTGS